MKTVTATEAKRLRRAIELGRYWGAYLSGTAGWTGKNVAKVFYPIRRSTFGEDMKAAEQRAFATAFDKEKK